MLSSALFFASHLLLGVGAFLVYPTFYVETWMEHGLNEACGKALLTDIDCDSNLNGMGRTGWQGLLRGDDDFTITDSICAPKCGESLQEWSKALSENCDPRSFSPITLVEGRIQLCDKDEKTGEYCNAIIDAFPDLRDDEVLVPEDLCEPCYVRRMWRFDISHYSPANGWIERSRDRMDKYCPKSVLAQKSATVVQDMSSTTTAAASDSSTVPEKVTTAESTIATPDTTASPTAETLEKVTASVEPNAGERLSYGKTEIYLSFALVLAVTIF
ncbi:hypothetical protein QX201_005479 [Fusarium graminearum]|nr:hypothetical protein FG05_02910 [Fusarium graminearum]PCD34527.1 hypothetical protein FGRA07_08845 [Fusarium graminearum]